MTTDRNQFRLDFPTAKDRKIEVRFGGSEVTSEGGVMLTALADRKLSLTAAVARLLPDHHAECEVRHTLRDLMRQR